MGRRHRLLDSPRWRKMRLAVLDRDGYRCQSCGRAGILEVDHIIAMQDGGDAWAMDNLQALCRGCHIEKTRGENQTMPDPRGYEWRELVRRRLDSA